MKSLGLFIPYATTFIAAFCIMVVELTAGRIIARYLGASLYTWTSVIGVVLAGISLGNYIGGRLADRFSPAKTLSFLFILASISCVTIPALNNLIGQWGMFWQLNWPLRITLHVASIFLLLSTILGMIGPVVAKSALDQGFKTGRTIGNVYAWGAIGSIIGTFLTGFFLVAAIGTTAVVWMVAGILGFVGLLYGGKKKLPYAWATVFLILVFLSFSSLSWAVVAGERLALRQEIDPKIIYQTESQYSYIKVEHSDDSPNARRLIINQLLHSIVRMDDPASIQNLYPYQEVYEAITRCFGKDKERLSTLFIGGGGYVFPRYIEKHWPGSYIEIVEIDPAVTEAAIQAFGLPRESSLRIHHLDARNHIEDLFRRKCQGETIPAFDFIYGDAFNGLSIPFQLITCEFNEKVRQLLAPDGIYMLNLADSIRSGQFLGAMVNTLQRSFPYVYVYLPAKSNVRADLSNTFVVVGSLRQIHFEELANLDFTGSQLEGSQLKLLKERSKGAVLTDDYAPVENLLKPVVYQRGLLMASAKFTDSGNTLFKEGKLKKAAKYYQKAIQLKPDFAEAYSNLACVLTYKGNFKQAIENYNKALEIKPEAAETHYNLGIVLSKEGRLNEALEHYSKAVELKPDFTQAKYYRDFILREEGK